MKVLQLPISDKHLNAMFFNGIIAFHTMNGKIYVLHTDSIGEIHMLNEKFVRYSNDDSINTLAILGLLNDEMLEDKSIVDIHVDSWIGLSELLGGELRPCDVVEMCDTYDEAIQMFALAISTGRL